MKIDLNKEQYISLMKLIYLGEYMANGMKTDEDFYEEFAEIEQYVYSLAKDFGCEDLIQKDQDGYFPKPLFEEDMEEIISEYEEDFFSDTLVHHLANKDLMNSLDSDTIDSMSFDEIIEQERPFVEKYNEEITQNGLKNIGLIR
jgi:hypothetical protein